MHILCKKIIKTMALYLKTLYVENCFNFAKSIFSTKTSNFNEEKYMLSLLGCYSI